MEQTNNTGAQGAKLYHLELRPKNGDKELTEHYYFPTLEALKNYMDFMGDDPEFYAWAYIMQIGSDGYFENVWECTDVDKI